MIYAGSPTRNAEYANERKEDAADEDGDTCRIGRCDVEIDLTAVYRVDVACQSFAHGVLVEEVLGGLGIAKCRGGIGYCSAGDYKSSFFWSAVSVGDCGHVPGDVTGAVTPDFLANFLNDFRGCNGAVKSLPLNTFQLL